MWERIARNQKDNSRKLIDEQIAKELIELLVELSTQNFMENNIKEYISRSFTLENAPTEIK